MQRDALREHPAAPVAERRTVLRALAAWPLGTALAASAATPALVPAARIVALGGALTEVVYLLGAEGQLVGTDTTSLFPDAAQRTAKVGYMRQLSAEGLLSLRPDAVMGTTEAGPAVVLDQVRSTMLVTVWVFIGIEGASVYSARAARREDVGRATVIGFLVCLALLMGVSLLSLGIFTQPELAALKNPSMAPVLEKAVGTWGAVAIYVGLIVSVGGGFLAWTLLAAESLFTPAGGGVMPAWLAQQNDKAVPAHALWLTNGMVQLFLLLTLVSKASYLALISLSTAMILIPYLFSAVYGLKLAWQGRANTGATATAIASASAAESHPARDISITALASVYCAWLLYAAGLKYLLLSALLYAPGAAIYLLAKKQRAERAFTGREQVVLALLLLLAAASAYMLWSGRLSL
jgi:arginine:ornithine antiporter/lysine permease